jgi:hypothetical protein
MARDRLASAVADHAAKLGRRPGRLTLRDPRSRWGSCSSRGDLMFSWRLIMAPPEVLDYVAAHEVAHLAEMNHSARLLVALPRLCPDDGDPPQAWLKAMARRFWPGGSTPGRRIEPMLMNPRPTDTGAAAAHDRVYRALRSRIMHGEVGRARR